MLAHCSAHVRRKFFDLAEADSAPITEEALRRIGELYVVEGEIRGQNFDLCAAACNKTSRPAVAVLEAWFKNRPRAVPGARPWPRRSATP